MKNNCIAKPVAGLLLMLLGACQLPGKKTEIAQTVAPAEQHAQRDTSMNYLLQPVNEKVIAAIPVIQGQKSIAIYIREIPGQVAYDTRNKLSVSSRVSGRIEKLYIKYNYQPVKKGQLILELYSPDLAAAQREMLLIQQSNSDLQLLLAAKQRLLLLGMPAALIQKVLHSGQVIYRIPVYSTASGYIVAQQQSAAANSAAPAVPAVSGEMNTMDAGNAQGDAAAGQNTAVNTTASAILLREGQYISAGQNIFSLYKTGNLVAEFSVTAADAAQLDKNAKVIIRPATGKGESITGRIGLIQPVFNAGENFTIVRVYLQQARLQVGELLRGQLPFLTAKTFWLPREALFSLGNQTIVFRKQGKVFIPEPVKTGVSQNNQVQVLNDITAWKIAKNAHYLVDSESFIKVQNHGK